MVAVKRYLKILLLLLFPTIILAVLPFTLFGKLVKPNEIGIRQNYFSVFNIKEGYEEVGLQPGLHWQIPQFSQIRTIPKDFLLINFSEDAQGDGNLSRLEITSKDGSKVHTDVTLLVRFYDREATTADASNDKTFSDIINPEIQRRKELARSRMSSYAEPTSELESAEAKLAPMPLSLSWNHKGPKDLVNLYRFESKEQLRLLGTTAEDVLKDKLGNLYSAKFYDPSDREKIIWESFFELNKRLSVQGIHVYATLMRRYLFEEQIDDRIFNKNLEQQKEILEKARETFKIEQKITSNELEKINQQILTVVEGGQSKFKIIVSEGENFAMKRKAEADRLVSEAIANVEKVKNYVFANTPGSEIFIARRFIPLISAFKGGILTDINPFEIEDWEKNILKTATDK